MHKDSEIKVDIYSDCLKNNDTKQVDLLKKGFSPGNHDKEIQTCVAGKSLKFSLPWLAMNTFFSTEIIQQLVQKSDW